MDEFFPKVAVHCRLASYFEEGLKYLPIKVYAADWLALTIIDDDFGVQPGAPTEIKHTSPDPKLV
jgi:hypothetical protein